jgi:asparagine synthase (glutamine-hydrolysing)
MRPRYLLLAGPRAGEVAQSLAAARCPAGLSLEFSAPELRAFVGGGCGCIAAGEGGCILGTLFRRDREGGEVRALSGVEAASISAGGGRHLLANYWGGYVAAFAASDGPCLMRDPSAALPCYFVQGEGLAAFSSDAELLVELGFADIELDWEALASHLYAGGVPSCATALCAIRELLPGFAVEFVAGECSVQIPYWSPWDHVAEAEGEGAGAAAERLAATIRRCVGSLAAVHGRLLVSVSGGLDSSIVAASLAAAGAEATCLTMFGEDSESDERPFARALCDHLRLPLVERRYRIEDVALETPVAPHLPRPSDRTHALAYERAHLEVARSMEAKVFVTGNGGDSLFGYSQSAAAIADRYLADGLGAGLVATIRDVCTQTGCSAAEAIVHAVRIARGPRAYRCRGQALFLDRDIADTLGQAALSHPWLEAPAAALPGKAAHIAAILRVLQCLEPGRARELPVVNPLMAQPIVEACLSVASWQWRSGGCDRSLARRAFAANLPPVILRRHVKGGPDGFTARVVESFRRQIRERLLDGHLARHRILDREAIAAELDDDNPGGGEQRARILELVAAEAWIESWLARSARQRSVQGLRRPIAERSSSQCSSSALPPGATLRRPRNQ